MEFTFLTKNQIDGKNQLDIFKKHTTRCAATDFALLSGCKTTMTHGILNEKNKVETTGYWWTQTRDRGSKVMVADDEGLMYDEYLQTTCIGARPVFKIEPQLLNELKGKTEFEYGSYPQTSVPRELNEKLTEKFVKGELKKSSQSYPDTDLISLKKQYNQPDNEYHRTYEYNGKIYIYKHGDRTRSNTVLSNRRKIIDREMYWIEVEPIKWLIDEKEGIAISKKILFSGVPFHDTVIFNGGFEESNIKQFLDEYFAPAIEQSLTYIQPMEIEEETEPIRKQNPYGFNFDEVSEEDIIKGALESGVSVFLHGRSSEGKSARVKQFDPDCEIIYLRNATPDSLNGKSVYNSETGEMIDVPPTWYKKIKKKCEEEPDKIHIVFFDEITNALPSIQGMAFNIVLDGEVNGIWKLPENARIVAAGNDLNDSLAANTMAEPLFNRFAHVYINTTVDSWLKWASTPNEEYERIDYKKKERQAKIHPAIYAYISYKSYLGKDVLRTPYNGEKPNADPRKWEMASKVLYATKTPEMLRALIDEELTYDFCAFCRQQVISIEDVIKGNYTHRDLDMNPAEKYATAVGLSAVDEQNLETVRNFVSNLGPEIRATFDTLWTRGDEKRLEKIAELKITEFQEGGMKK